MNIVPITFRQACNYVAGLHRHNRAPRGHKFSIGLIKDSTMVGVAMASRPVSRNYDNGLTVEIIRVCTDGTRNANSMLYGAIWKSCKAMGYQRCITYTQHDESGDSLRGAGWVRERDIPARGSWSEGTKNETLKAMRHPVGNGGVDRVLWSIESSKSVPVDLHEIVKSLCRTPVTAEQWASGNVAPFTPKKDS